MPTPDSDAEYMGLVEAPDTTIADAGSGAHDQEPVAAEEGKPEVSDSYDPKTDPKRVEYWQSKADQYKHRAEELEVLEPLGKLVREREDVRKAIEDTIQGKPKTLEPEVKKPEVEKPIAPVRPVDYDSVAAVQDPDSPSFKFRVDQLQYQEQLLSYYDKREEMRQGAFEQQRQESLRREQAAIADATLRARLSEKGILGAEQDKFIEVMGAPESFRLENLITLYEVVQGKTPQVKPPSADEKAKKLREQIERGKAPLPPGLDGGTSDVPVKETEEGIFNQSLFEASKRRPRVAVVAK